MNRQFKCTLMVILSGFFMVPASISAGADSLDQLLIEMKQLRQQSSLINQQRERQFIKNKHQQKQLLNQTKQQLIQLKAEIKQNKHSFDINEKTIVSLQEKLQQKTGVLGELSGVIKEKAGDMSAIVSQSIISAQYPGRQTIFDSIAKHKQFPTIEQLETLWYDQLKDMTESGKIVQYTTEILLPNGKRQSAQVTRIGPFNAMTASHHLKYIPQTQQFQQITPIEHPWLQTFFPEAYAGNSDQLTLTTIDPSRGSILNILIAQPSWNERIQQGGVIGYVILGLGLMGLLIFLERLIYLSQVKRKIKRQLFDLSVLNQDNPIGRILGACHQQQENNADYKDIIENQIDEAVMKEIPAIEKGRGLLKLLTGVTPLLGLLGTVTGMILTFNSISLFGTGDPRLMADGISQALVTTMLGLMAAVPLLFMHTLIAAKCRNVVQILDEQSAGIMAQILEKHHVELDH